MSDLFPLEHLFHPLDSAEERERILARLALIDSQPLTHSQLNQLLHLSHQAGMTEDFFRYYFLETPVGHPYQVAAPPIELPHVPAITSTAQLRWGLERFAVDAALYWGDFRNAYRALRELTYDELVLLFFEKCLPTNWMRLRGPVMPLQPIAIPDRHLVSELAGKALDAPAASGPSLLEQALVDAYRRLGSGQRQLNEIVTEACNHSADLRLLIAIPLAAADLLHHTIDDEADLRALLDLLRQRFLKVRDAARSNTKHYLSICNELDVYVATSMREAKHFRDAGEACDRIFSSPMLAPYDLRWFDPTMSACVSHEDKGLIECLMVDQARLVLYFAGETDSWGKDAEAAMALSRGKPVIILCPDTQKGKERMQVFREVHPLSRLTDYVNGVAVGAMVTLSEEYAIEIMRRYFESDMVYTLKSDAKGFSLREDLTQSTVRTVTGDRMLRETFWNYYHSVP